MNTQKTLISNWLNEPHHLSVGEQDQVAELLKRFPYLVPAKWMQQSEVYVNHGFTKDMLHEGQLYMGNWMQYYSKMTACKQEAKQLESIIAEPIVELNNLLQTEEKIEVPQVDIVENNLPAQEEIILKEEENLILEEQMPNEIENLPKDILTEENEEQEKILDEEESLILNETVPQVTASPESVAIDSEELVLPVYTENYFLHQGIVVPDIIPAELDKATQDEELDDEKIKSLMVMMGFEDWLNFLRRKNEAKLSDEEDKAIVRSIWQKEKLAAAMGEEDDNIPEAVFEMAINSINKQEIMVSESLAEIHAKQGRFEKAIEIYRKLSLQNPEKKTYFAAKINHLNKEKLL